MLKLFRRKFRLANSNHIPDGTMTKEELDFLQKDFAHWGEAYFRSEESGERRLSFFIGVVTAALGGLGFLATRGQQVDLNSVRGLGIATSLTLVVLGQLTLLRIIRRNAASDGYLHALSVIRRHIVPGSLVEAYTSRLPRGRSVWTGGLAYIVAFVSAGLGAMAAWLAYQSVLPALGALVVLVVLQAMIEIPWLERRARAAGGRAPNTFRPGVGLLVSNGAGKVLALERRDVRGAWQLPQGGVEEGEELEAAAWRELGEETGLTTDQVALVGRGSFWIGYELPQHLRSAKTGRGQVQQWFHFRSRTPGLMPQSAGSDEAARLEWKALSAVVEGAVEFRRPVYEMVAREFDVELKDEIRARTAG
jgi:putative (di)nucleoside polyphosphate hydrolase